MMTRPLLLLLFWSGAGMAAQNVLVMRHCVRSPYPSLRSGRGAQGFDYPDNYTAATFPAQWNTSSTAACTPRGIELSQKFAQSLSAHLTAPVSIVADNVTRNLQTAQAVRQGLGSSAGEVQPDGALFNPVSNKVCADLSTEEYNGQIQGQLASVADPKSPLHSEWSQHQVKLAELQTLVGTGVAPALEHIPTNVSGGYLTGGLYVASEGLIETFMLEAGSGLSVAWGSLDGSNRSALYHNWLELHGLYAHLNHGGVKIGARNGGAVLWHTLEELDSTDGGSSVLVGHDLTLDGIGSLLGISWGCGPFSESATPPMSGLLFSRTSAGNVAIQAVCARFEGGEAGEVILGEVKLGGHVMPTAGVSVSELREIARPNIDFDCVKN